MLFDTHTHYTDERFDEDRDILLASMQEKGVSEILLASTSLQNSLDNLELAKSYDFMYVAVGVHPHDSEKEPMENGTNIEKLLSNDKVVAIGECGLDYYYDFSPKDLQKSWFERQLIMSKEFDTPIIIHDRDAHKDTMELVQKYKPKGVFHCYTGSSEMAKEILKLGMYISFSGSVTFKNAVNLRLAAEVVPPDRLLIETDCPYLAPDPYRGKRNDSSLVGYTCRKLSEIKNIPFEQLSEITRNNAKILFNIK